MTYPSAPQPQQPDNGMMKPNNFLIPNILATIFCCLPGGIVGIIMAVGALTGVTRKIAGKLREALLPVQRHLDQFLYRS